MTPKEFAYHVRFMTRTGTTPATSTLPDADIVSLMKIRQDELAKAILKADEDILLIPQYTDLVANQREYPLPQDMLSSIKRVEVLFSGTQYVPLTEIDVNDIKFSIETEDEITAHFNCGSVDFNNPNGARFDLSRKSLTIYTGTIDDVTNGIKILVNTWPEAVVDLTATNDMSQDPSTTTHGIPRELHELWARGVIIDWKSSRAKPIPLTEKELKYEVDKETAIKSLKPQNLDRDTYQEIPPASDRGDNGTNY